jgi:DNA-binding NarL/FixJ family response regulator
MLVDLDQERTQRLGSALGLQKDLRVVATANKRESALKQITIAPQVMLLHISVLQQRTLSRFLRTVQAKSPSTRVIVLHGEFPEDKELIDQIRMGIRGYLRAMDPPALIVKAIRSVAEGRIWAERRILEKTISRHLLLPETIQAHVPDLQPLTGREMDMLNMVMKGATNREIAEMSNISERTVKTHLYRVYRKLKVKSRAKAIALLSHS